MQLQKALKKIKKIFAWEKDSLIRLAINGEVIETTEEHPFWIKDQGWIPAGNLKKGDLTKLQSGEYVPIESYEVVILDEPITVYNFHVEDFECYYVSGQRVLVHNMCAKKVTRKSGKEKANDDPDWSKRYKPKEGEDGKDFAKRICDDKYGKGNYDKGPGSEFNKIRKGRDRGKKK